VENPAVQRNPSVLKKLANELSSLLSALHGNRRIANTFIKIGNYPLGKNLGSGLRIYHFNTGLMPGQPLCYMYLLLAVIGKRKVKERPS